MKDDSAWEFACCCTTCCCKQGIMHEYSAGTVAHVCSDCHPSAQANLSSLVSATGACREETDRGTGSRPHRSQAVVWRDDLLPEHNHAADAGLLTKLMFQDSLAWIDGFVWFKDALSVCWNFGGLVSITLSMMDNSSWVAADVSLKFRNWRLYE